MDIEFESVKNWIVLTLTNVNPNAASTVILFKNPTSSPLASAVSYGQGVFGIKSADFGSTFTITYKENNISSIIVTPVMATIDDLVSYINTLFDASVNNCCTYLEPTPGDFQVYSFSSVFTLMKIEGSSSGVHNAVNLGLSVVNGSFVDVQVESTDLTYNELVSELMYQPYKIELANVYANNINQANKPFNLNEREVNGSINDKQLHPAMSPTYTQYVNENIPLEFLTSTTNLLQYTVGAGENLRIIFTYSNKDLIALPEKEIFVPKDDHEQIPLTIVKVTTDTVPILDLVKKSINKTNGKLLKQIIKPFVNQRAISKEEVYSAFNGYDFKECEDSQTH